jgi:hypothetical protein
VSVSALAGFKGLDPSVPQGLHGSDDDEVDSSFAPFRERGSSSLANATSCSRVHEPGA